MKTSQLYRMFFYTSSFTECLRQTGGAHSRLCGRNTNTCYEMQFQIACGLHAFLHHKHATISIIVHSFFAATFCAILQQKYLQNINEHFSISSINNYIFNYKSGLKGRFDAVVPVFPLLFFLLCCSRDWVSFLWQ